MAVNVIFETRLVEDQRSQAAQGKYAPREADFAVFRIPGDKNTVIEKEVTEAEQEYWAITGHLQHVPALYKAWKDGMDAPVSGTPIKEWPLMSPSQIHQAITTGIRTVEDFASLSDEGLRAFGTGAINLKTKAKIWLETASNQGKVVEEMSALKAQMAMMQDQLKQAEEKAQAASKAPARSNGKFVKKQAVESEEPAVVEEEPTDEAV